MHRIQTSFKTFVLVRAKVKPKQNQPITIKTRMLIRKDKQKCLVCGGMPKVCRIPNKGFYSRSIPYPHKAECTNQ